MEETMTSAVATMVRKLSFLLTVLAAALVVPAPGQASTGISWPRDQALPWFAPPQHLDVADVQSLPGDEQLLFNTLEGLVNRTEPRIYLVWGADEGPRTWLDTLRNAYGVPTTDIADPWTLVVAYRSEVCGMIVYDPAVPDSINVATSLAGADGAVVASPNLAVRLAADPYDLPVREDLRGRFTARLDAYEWEYE